jgi:hypothetical protein
VRFSGFVTMLRSLIRIGRICRCYSTSSPWYFPSSVSFLSAFVVAGACFRSYSAKTSQRLRHWVEKTSFAKNVYCWHTLAIPSHHASPCFSCTGYWGDDYLLLAIITIRVRLQPNPHVANPRHLCMTSPISRYNVLRDVIRFFKYGHGDAWQHLDCPFR